jgi:phosphoribosyl-ATP pyrophosphohydrolase/phosphoribosyl-AMP cyclohydrolase
MAEPIDYSQSVLDFSKLDGLVPGIVQDARSGEVLMVGFLNQTSFQRTLETGYVTFWSRTRQTLWTKGETSGNRLRVLRASTDCDQDTLLFRVQVEGDGLVCHEGTVSCFTRPIDLPDADPLPTQPAPAADTSPSITKAVTNQEASS